MRHPLFWARRINFMNSPFISWILIGRESFTPFMILFVLFSLFTLLMFYFFLRSSALRWAMAPNINFNKPENISKEEIHQTESYVLITEKYKIGMRWMRDTGPEGGWVRETARGQTSFERTKRIKSEMKLGVYFWDSNLTFQQLSVFLNRTFTASFRYLTKLIIVINSLIVQNAEKHQLKRHWIVNR